MRRSRVVKVINQKDCTECPFAVRVWSFVNDLGGTSVCRRGDCDNVLTPIGGAKVYDVPERTESPE